MQGGDARPLLTMSDVASTLLLFQRISEFYTTLLGLIMSNLRNLWWCGSDQELNTVRPSANSIQTTVVQQSSPTHRLNATPRCEPVITFPLLAIKIVSIITTMLCKSNYKTVQNSCLEFVTSAK